MLYKNRSHQILGGLHYLGICKGNAPCELTCNIFGKAVENGKSCNSTQHLYSGQPIYTGVSVQYTKGYC